MKELFHHRDLPLADLQKLSLYKEGKLSLDRDDIYALISGRRTALISLTNLKVSGIEISRLDARLSLAREPDGRPALKIHPVYKQPRLHALLPGHEADLLITGKISTLQKIYQNGQQSRVYNFEYDPETKEFISYDPQQVTVPETVNMHQLTERQKQIFRNGAMVILDDGTRLQYRAADPKGIRADRATLMLGVRVDGNISQVSIGGIKNLINNLEPQKYIQSEAYPEARHRLNR